MINPKNERLETILKNSTDEIDYKKINKIGLNAAKRMGLSDDEAEEFAQEYSIQTFAKLRLETMKHIDH